MIIMTGRKGMYDFDTYIKLEYMDEKSLKEAFVEHRKLLYDLKEELHTIKSKRWYKLLKFLKRI
jgi:hypothetical protein